MGEYMTFTRDVPDREPLSLDQRIRMATSIILVWLVSSGIAMFTALAYYLEAEGLWYYVGVITLGGFGTLMVGWVIPFQLFLAPYMREKIINDTGRPVGMRSLFDETDRPHNTLYYDGALYDTTSADVIMMKERVGQGTGSTDFLMVYDYLLKTNKDRRVMHVQFRADVGFDHILASYYSPAEVTTSDFQIMEDPNRIMELIVNRFGPDQVFKIFDVPLTLGDREYVFKSVDWVA